MFLRGFIEQNPFNRTSDSRPVEILVNHYGVKKRLMERTDILQQIIILDPKATILFRDVTTYSLSRVFSMAAHLVKTEYKKRIMISHISSTMDEALGRTEVLSNKE